MILPIRDTIRSAGRPYAVWALLAVNVLVFLWQKNHSPEEFALIVRTYGVVPLNAFSPGRVFAFLTYMFLHADFFHLVANCWVLFIFGDNVESLTGRVRFVAFYLLCGIAACVVHILFNQGESVPIVGASGAIAGVMGAYFLRYPKAKVTTFLVLIFMDIPAFVYLALWFLMQIAYGLKSASNVAWWAHVGGFLAGMLLFQFFALKKAPKPYHKNRQSPAQNPVQNPEQTQKSSPLLPPSGTRRR